ncbi:MAG TPA: ABC transporter substrate-binding protein [Symbiobacteriaceae bacterium]|nr:ABC transporter substrate-binding protein [Symbiobacteriaceae bacterium]
MKWRKLMAGVITAVLALSLVVGCSGTKKEEPKPAEQPAQTTPAPEPEKKVELEFWGWWSSATRMPTINKIVDGWNKEHPNIQVKYTFVPFGDLMTKYLASVAAGNPPDVVASPDIFTVPTRAQKKQAMELSTLGADAIKDQFYPEFWKAVLYQGKAYALPWVGETKYLYYNKDHFKAAGLDPEKGPVTWDDLWSFADKLDKKEGGKLVQAGFHPLFGNFAYRGWVWNSGSLFFDNREWPTINTEKNISVMDWIKKWTDRYGYESYAAMKGANGSGPQNLFIQQKISMTIETATWEGELKKNGPSIKYGIVPVPTPDGKQFQNANYTGGFDVEIPVGAKNPKQAFEFAKYWATDAAVIWAQEQNDFPAYTKAAEKITTTEFKRMVDNMKYTGLIPLPQFAPLYNDALDVAVQDVISGKKSAKDALGTAQGEIQKMVQQNTSK